MEWLESSTVACWFAKHSETEQYTKNEMRIFATQCFLTTSKDPWNSLDKNAIITDYFSKKATFKPVKKQQTNFGLSKKFVKTCYELINSVQVGQWQGLWYVARVYNKRHFGNSQSFEYHGSNSMQLLPSFNPINDQANFLTIIQIRWNLLNMMILFRMLSILVLQNQVLLKCFLDFIVR